MSNQTEEQKARKRARKRAWRAVNREKVLATNKKSHAKLTLEVRKHYSGGESCCCFCGISEEEGRPSGPRRVRQLSLDHIGGWGWGDSLYRKANKRISYARISKEKPDGFRVLCIWCNMVAVWLEGVSHITRLQHSKDCGLFALIHQLRNTNWSDHSG